ncbi:MAG: DUF424 family protein [Candidatus Aenigmarchaeota archaeon]|nr:DUF424 family protein [Candidatus Aenigmarchaeota archaeon]
MFWAKAFRIKSDVVVALCDEDILGKEIKWKKIKVKVSKHFYGERLIDEKTAVKLMEKATIGNLFGKEIVSIAKKNGFITKENIILIDGIPHAQFVKI